MSWRPTVVDIVGTFTEASNATLLATTDDGTSVVYKPRSGERPLWDFPAGSLADREVLSHWIDRSLGFGLVPETVLAGGPLGEGAVQRFVAHEARWDPLTSAGRGDAVLWPVAVLDLVANNADRKLGHILKTPEGLASVDHGLTFHEDDKLRTVLWAFAGRQIPDRYLGSLRRLRRDLDDELGDDVAPMLAAQELEALVTRIDDLLANPVHPLPPGDRPPLPWPPY